MNIFWPCSVESYNQLLDVANWLILLQEKYNIFDDLYLRWWCWKPRTKPWNFEWLWIEWWDIMLKVREKTWLKIITEIWTIEHLKYCLDNHFDGIWIWARNSSSPFFVEEVIETIKEYWKENILIWIKNCLAEDYELIEWIIERFKNKWLNNLVLIHRWFTIDKTFINNLKQQNFDLYKQFITLRNSLLFNDENKNNDDNFIELIWNVRNIPRFDNLKEIANKYNIKLLNDYSHICWNKELVKLLIKILWIKDTMIEIHNDAENALTDKKQQISTNELEELIKKDS